jgi:hypothetical protein
MPRSSLPGAWLRKWVTSSTRYFYCSSPAAISFGISPDWNQLGLAGKGQDSNCMAEWISRSLYSDFYGQRFHGAAVMDDNMGPRPGLRPNSSTPGYQCLNLECPHCASVQTNACHSCQTKAKQPATTLWQRMMARAARARTAVPLCSSTIFRARMRVHVASSTIVSPTSGQRMAHHPGLAAARRSPATGEPARP